MIIVPSPIPCLRLRCLGPGQQLRRIFPGRFGCPGVAFREAQQETKKKNLCMYSEILKTYYIFIYISLNMGMGQVTIKLALAGLHQTSWLIDVHPATAPSFQPARSLVSRPLKGVIQKGASMASIECFLGKSWKIYGKINHIRLSYHLQYAVRFIESRRVWHIPQVNVKKSTGLWKQLEKGIPTSAGSMAPSQRRLVPWLCSKVPALCLHRTPN